MKTRPELDRCGQVLPQQHGARSGTRLPARGVQYIERSEAAASEWAGRAGLGGLKGEVEGYTSHGRNYFQEEVTCGPSWGTFQIPIPVSVCSRGKSLDPSALLDGHPRWGRLDPSSPRSERRKAPTSGPQERCQGQAPGELVTQAPTSKHVPPPPLSAGCRRFVHGDAESPRPVTPFRLQPIERARRPRHETLDLPTPRVPKRGKKRLGLRGSDASP